MLAASSSLRGGWTPYSILRILLPSSPHGD
jgi:hypothetical protein